MKNSLLKKISIIYMIAIVLALFIMPIALIMIIIKACGAMESTSWALVCIPLYFDIIICSVIFIAKFIIDTAKILPQKPETLPENQTEQLNKTNTKNGGNNEQIKK